MSTKKSHFILLRMVLCFNKIFVKKNQTKCRCVKTSEIKEEGLLQNSIAIPDLWKISINKG